jgi:hypothetical protein
MLSTLLIAWKAWCAAETVYVPISPDDGTLRELRRTMGVHFKQGSPADRMESVLALLIESGFLYCLLWVTVFSTALSSLLNWRMPLDILLVHCIQYTPRCWFVHCQHFHVFHLGALIGFTNCAE